MLPLDPWLPHSLPQQLAALGTLYRDALEQGGRTRDEALASIGWRLYAAVFFASGLAPLQHLSELTSLTVGELGLVLADYADDAAPRISRQVPVLAACC